MNGTEQFETLVGEHYESLFRFAMSLTRSESDAQDLTQQTFYIWATKGHQLRDLSRVKSWLYTTMNRAFLQARRRQGRFTHHVLEDVTEELPTVSPLQAEEIDSSQVLSALAGVDEAYQAAVALFYLEEHSYKEIAAILEVAVGTVKSRIARGIGQLRQMLSLKISRASPCDPTITPLPCERGTLPTSVYGTEVRSHPGTNERNVNLKSPTAVGVA